MFIESVMPFTISSSVTPFSSCLQSFPASGSFWMSRFLKVEPGVLERCWKGKVESRKMVLKTRKGVCVRNSFIQWLCYLELDYSLWGFMTSSLKKVGGLPLSLLKNVCEILEGSESLCQRRWLPRVLGEECGWLFYICVGKWEFSPALWLK